jgi:hypothetical protein
MKHARNYTVVLLGLLTPRLASSQVVTEFAPVEEPPSEPAQRVVPTPLPPPDAPPATTRPTSSNATPAPTVRVASPSRDANPTGLERRSLTLQKSEDVDDFVEEPAKPSTHAVSLTFSAARVIASLYEVTGEIALGDHVGLAVLAGLGSLDVKHPSYPATINLEGKELGAQARVYVLGDFDHGLMLGGELLRIWAEASSTRVMDSVTINGVRYDGTALLGGEGTLTGLGAFVGYKVVASFGLTFDAKLGWQKLTLDGSGSLTGEAVVNGQTQQRSETKSIRESENVPLFNLNLGWSI